MSQESENTKKEKSSLIKKITDKKKNTYNRIFGLALALLCIAGFFFPFYDYEYIPELKEIEKISGYDYTIGIMEYFGLKQLSSVGTGNISKGASSLDNLEKIYSLNEQFKENTIEHFFKILTLNIVFASPIFFLIFGLIALFASLFGKVFKFSNIVISLFFLLTIIYFFFWSNDINKILNILFFINLGGWFSISSMLILGIISKRN